MAMRPRSGKKPRRLGYTVKRLLGYMGRHKLLLFAVAACLQEAVQTAYDARFFYRQVAY